MTSTTLRTLLVAAVWAMFALPTFAVACPSSGSMAVAEEEPEESTSREKLAWRTDLRNALTEAKASQKPVLVFFSTDACGACDEMVETTLRDARVTSALKDFVTVYVDMSDTAQVKTAKELGIGSVPALVFFNNKGKRLSSMNIDQFISADQLLPMVKKVG
ncbi:MAG: thioredoxin family protein [Myxococcota bacterium]